MKLRIAALAALASLVLPGAAAALRMPEPGRFAADVIRTLSQNDAAAWATLHPAQQALVPRDLYLRCASAGASLRTVTVLHVAAGRFPIADGDAQRGAAVTLRTAAGVRTVRLVPLGDGWRWVLPPKPLGDYVAGRCPA